MVVHARSPAMYVFSSLLSRYTVLKFTLHETLGYINIYSTRQTNTKLDRLHCKSRKLVFLIDLCFGCSSCVAAVLALFTHTGCQGDEEKNKNKMN